MKYDHLLGRPFELGRTDCFDMVIHFYYDNFGIVIKNYARPRDWNSAEIDIIGRAHEREGFRKVSEWTLATLLPGDVLCMAVGSSVANHYAIYIGGNEIIHHKINGLSSKETLRDFWRRSTCYVLRHKDVHTSNPTKPEVYIKDLIDARNRIPTTEVVRPEEPARDVRPDPE